MRIPQCAPLSPIGRIPLCTASRSPQCAPLRAQYIRTSQCQCAPLFAPHPFSAKFAPLCAPSGPQCAPLGAPHPSVHNAHPTVRTPLVHDAHPSVHHLGPRAHPSPLFAAHPFVHNTHLSMPMRTPLCLCTVQFTMHTLLCTASL